MDVVIDVVPSGTLVRLTTAKGTFLAVTRGDPGQDFIRVSTNWTNDLKEFVDNVRPDKVTLGHVVAASMVTPRELEGVPGPGAAKYRRSFSSNMNKAVVTAFHEFPGRKKELFRLLTSRVWPKHPEQEEESISDQPKPWTLE